MITVLYEDRARSVPSARVEGDSLWVPVGELRHAIGWDLRDEGLCASEVCIPVPSGASWLKDDHFDLTAFARHMGQPVVHDDRKTTWAFGDPASGGPASETAEAPDFTLPDLDGTMHSLSDHRGKKVLIVTWASW